MLHMAIQPCVNGVFTNSCFPPQKLGFKPLKESINFRPRISSLHQATLAEFKLRPNRKGVKLSVSAAAIEAVEKKISSEDSTSVAPDDSQLVEEKEKLEVVVKPMEKPRLVLKFIWLAKNIGLALDQNIPGHGTIPLSPYYFWPRKDAWEELKTLLENTCSILRDSMHWCKMFPFSFFDLKISTKSIRRREANSKSYYKFTPPLKCFFPPFYIDLSKLSCGGSYAHFCERRAQVVAVLSRFDHLMPPKSDNSEGIVLNFVNEQNRPLNSQNVADALQKYNLKKTSVQKHWIR
ncbi:hypothetical protein NE237_021192 [Protea cynaroides]|uniref:30S ribosomal protein 3, chloroplastic n=1 Tax=Protea cynaroides TaxID=273540 RepID=A0A9Q0H7I8_9MAGN|nr:hypothetical protein NE237_021192 [Protea cynaroides]